VPMPIWGLLGRSRSGRPLRARTLTALQGPEGPRDVASRCGGCWNMQHSLIDFEFLELG
jgi:hypothetical protein